MQKVIFTSLIFLLTSTSSVRGGGRIPATNEVEFIQAIQQLLVDQGFENIVVKLNTKPKEKEMIIEYENRRYRYEMRAMGVVCVLVSSKLRNIDRVTLIPKNRDIPLVKVTINLLDYASFIKGEISSKAFASRLNITQNPLPDDFNMNNTFLQTDRTNDSFRKIDLFVRPEIKARLGNFDDPYKLQLNIIPEISSFLFKGMKATAELVIPLQNELSEEGDEIRPGKIVLNQTLRFPANIFSSLSLGYFAENRYGLSLEILNFLLNGNLSFSAKVDYTGFLLYIDNHWYYSDISKWTYLLNASYQFSLLDFSVSISRGRFLLGDVGWRLDMLRSFGETDIGFFAIKTNTKTFGGFKLQIPIFPMRRLTPYRIRANPPLYFDWTYRYYFADSGTAISTCCSVRDFIKGLVPSYIKNNVAEFKKACKF